MTGLITKPGNVTLGKGIYPAGIGTLGGSSAFPSGRSPSAYAPYPAPPGYAWDWATINGVRATINDVPAVILIKGH